MDAAYHRGRQHQDEQHGNDCAVEMALADTFRWPPEGQGGQDIPRGQVQHRIDRDHLPQYRHWHGALVSSCRHMYFNAFKRSHHDLNRRCSGLLSNSFADIFFRLFFLIFDYFSFFSTLFVRNNQGSSAQPHQNYIKNSLLLDRSLCIVGTWALRTASVVVD
jgi:hypothetical protein